MAELLETQKAVPVRQRVGRIHSIESMGAVDGPGIRFVVFLQGCQMRCQYCHNPDTWKLNGGTEQTVGRLADQVRQYQSFMRASGGGVTISGGEPLLQAPFVAALMAECHRMGIHTALDTSGYVPSLDQVNAVLDHTDLVLLDLKLMNPEKHKELTGRELDRILYFADLVTSRGIPIWIRHVVVPGVTDDPEDVDALGRFVAALPGVQRVDLLPYHLLGKHKWEALGIRYQLDEVQPPSDELMERVAAQLRAHGLPVAQMA
ncbi:MAG: pyruvate formate lyase activating enzyme [Symbiobacteriaceae bacterium]|jgi:pyruvate formate lyase activating enzyme|nr:pyruvate formate lyase activating enzyme [Symbiobacteriaceae bacterium]